ncbi:Glutathione-binding protein GsiB precursor (plasmid) [Sulfitobacter sp. THAF37]|uniref:ABC transporter substrate-binding protein n=1 Tax=Sulfitobacter sp. THAF37 TaxID=2587855 RepID=UPI0012A815A2|nr:ABC transporter substrate-binding protein [Sulfitobacter sp. THAF37]QFT60745.1 Glutathione-binding protein GsiB precursor [Sulfitobacter sp. THAF37]
MLALITGEGVAAQDSPALTVASPAHFMSLDPAVAGDNFLHLGIGETLVDADTNGRLRPGLATDWSVSDDALRWTFTLRDGVRFHDDTMMDADTVKAALDRAVSMPGVLDKAPIADIRADGNTIVVGLNEPFAALPAMLAHSSTVIFAPSSFDGDTAVGSVGTGPFRMTGYAPPQSLDAKRFDGYWGEKANLESFRYLSASRAETRALMAESGDADLVFTLDPAGFRRLQSVDGVETAAVPIPRTTIIKVNAGHPFLDAPEARQALSLAIDRAGIAAGIMRFPDSGANQLFPPALAGWHVDGMEPLVTDVDRAKSLLAELGWTPGSDGILTREGERFALTLRTYPDRPELPLIGAALQDQWRAIGIDLTVSVSNFSEIPQGDQDGSLDVALYARNFGLIPDPIGIVIQDYGTGGGDWGTMNWDRPDVAEAVTRISRVADLAERQADIDTVARALQEDLPVIPVLWYQQTVAWSGDLRGVVIDPLERTYGLSQISRAD